MKKQLMIIALLLGSFQITLAQSDTTKQFGKRRGFSPVMTIDNLTNDQKTKMEEIRKEHLEKRNAIENDAVLSSDQKMEALKKIRLEKRTRIGEVLTEEQREQYKQQAALKREHHKSVKAEKKAKTPLSANERALRFTDKLDKVVGLTEKQREKVFSSVVESELKKEDIFKNKSISREETGSALKELRAEREKELNRILSKKQMKLWNEDLAAKKEKRALHKSVN